jgi:hypothetical protein
MPNLGWPREPLNTIDRRARRAAGRLVNVQNSE